MAIKFDRFMKSLLEQWFFLGFLDPLLLEKPAEHSMKGAREEIQNLAFC